MSEAPDRETDLADHPGRRRGRDEVDPELLVIPRPRPRIGPLLALSVVVFCAYFLVRLRSDLVFAHSGSDPEPVAGVAGAMAADIDSYVELDAAPDRAATLRVYASEARDAHRLAPVAGSADRLWLLYGGSHWVEQPVYQERVRGRIKRLADLPFHDQLIAELAATRLPRALTPGAVVAALASTGWHARAHDAAGDPVALEPGTPVTILERSAGEARVTGFATDRHPDEKAWRAALERAGVLAAGAPLESSTESSWSFLVPAPEAVEPLAAQLVKARLFAARAEPVDRAHRTVWGNLGVEGGDLLVGMTGATPVRIQPTSITSILVQAQRRLPPDARVLVTTDRPQDYWHVTVVVVFLGVLALAFAWALWRGLAPAREPNEPPNEPQPPPPTKPREESPT